MHDSPHIIPLENIDFGEIDFKITVAEVQKQVPFAIERVYWLTTHTRGAERGNHAHINSSQLLIAIQGHVSVRITDRKQGEHHFRLDTDRTALYVPPNHWLTLEMPEHAVLLCLSSHRFVNQVTTYDFNEFTGA